MDDLIRIAKELGLPGVALTMAFYLSLQLGKALREGIAWSGPAFLLPIRDGLLGNINVLTNFIMEMRATLPLVKEGHEKTLEAIDSHQAVVKEMEKDNAKTRATMRAVVAVMSGRCPVTDSCPFKATNIMDSDDTTDQIRHERDKPHP